VAILDADKEGFLRSQTSLIQTIGRAARNAQGQVVMYADEVTPSMERAIEETYRRREKQQSYNLAHGIVPKTIQKEVRDVLEITSKATHENENSTNIHKLSKEERERHVRQLTLEMKMAAKLLEFEHAAFLRDEIEKIKRLQ
jgi:excinuclease ABC subunit B